MAATCLAVAAFGACAAQLQVHDQAVIAPQPIDGLVPTELSGLAWDADEQLLYAVSDQGLLFHFRLVLEGTRLRQITPVRAVRLTPTGSDARARLNAEGLALIDGGNGKRGDTQLVVALENGPSLTRFAPDGRALGDVALPTPLRDAKAYRGGNRLESVSVHAKHGFVTAPQLPLKALPADMHRVYATDGSEWSLPAGERGAVKAIEALPDGALLVLERQGKGKAFMPVPRRVDPAACAHGTPCGGSNAMPLPGLEPSDNYEGLAQLSQRLFVIVSDDGGNAKRPTRLVLFSLDPRQHERRALAKGGR